MAASNADVMRGSGPSVAAPGSAIQQIAHHQLASTISTQQHHSIPPNHHIQQLQNLTQQTVTVAAGHHHVSNNPSAMVHHHHRVHQQQQHQLQQLAQQQSLQHPSLQHRIGQYNGNMGNLMFPSSENLSGPGSSNDTNLAASASASDISNTAVVNIASVNHHPTLGSVAAKDGVANNSSTINPVLNRIATNVAGSIPVENVPVMQQQQQQPTSESMSPKAGGSAVTRSNVAPGWRRIKYNCEIIYIR